MNASENIKKELDSLDEMVTDLLKLAKDRKDVIKFGFAYQDWYSRAHKVIEILAPERLQEFTSYYLIDPKRKTIYSRTYVIQDYIQGAAAHTSAEWNPSDIVQLKVTNQAQILKALSFLIDSLLHNIEGHLFADLQDSELAAADQLKQTSLRAAGALAGVVLERHLQRVAHNHNISIRKKSPTISDLNDPLRSANVYDIPTWRKIQLLADIRNLCVHEKGREPTDEEVDDLISGVNSVIKSVF